MTSVCASLETARLRLRPFERNDIDAVCAYHTLPSVQRYLLNRTRDRGEVASVLDLMSRQVSLQRPGDVLSMAIMRRSDRQIIGQIVLIWHDATAGQGEIRFALHPAFSGQGYLTEAISRMLDIAFGQYRIHRILVRCDGRNHHSIALLQQMGMRLEAHFREHALFQGEWDEELHFAILDREWRQSSKVRELPVRHRVA